MYSSQSFSNHGILTKGYWATQEIELRPTNTTGYNDVNLRASWPVKDLSMFVERSLVQTYVGGSNALSLAASDSFDTNSQASGQYPINLNIQRFEWDSLGFSVKGKSDSYEGISWKLEPKIVTLRAFKSGNGDAILAIGSNINTLNGTLHRESNSSYGYLVNPAQLDMGYGASADAFLKIDLQPAITLAFDVKNIGSRFIVHGAHENDRSYQVVQSAGQIIFSQVPSISGTYGQKKIDYRLPIFYKVGLSKDGPLSYGAGVIGFDSEKMGWARIGFRTGLNQVDVTSYAFNNLEVTFRRDNFFVKGLSVGFVFLTGFSGKPKLQLQTAIYDF